MSEVTRLTPESRLAALNAEIEAENKAKEEASKANAIEQKEEVKVEVKEDIKDEVVEKAEAKAEVIEEKKPEKTFDQILEEEKERKAEERKRARLASLEKSKVANLLLDLEDEGKSIEEIASIANKLKDLDVKDLSDEFIFNSIISSELNEDGNPLTDDEKIDAYERFKSLSPSIQKSTLDAKRKEIEDKRNSEIARLTNDKKSALTKINECLPLVESKAKEIYGKVVNGVEMNEKLTLEFHREASRQLVGSTDVNGDINTEKAISNALKIVLFDEIEARAKESGEKAGLEKAFKENHNPSEDGKIAKSQKHGEKTKEQQEDEALDAYKRRMNPLRKPVQTN